MEKAGACFAGFADLSRLDMPVTREYPIGICFALRHQDPAVDALPRDEAWLQMGSALAAQAKKIYRTAEDRIASWGYRCRKITSHLPAEAMPDLREELPQKTLATLAGLGWIGKSTLLVSPEYGPRIRLGTLLTDMPLATDAPMTQSRCGRCDACVKACPVGAITGAAWSQGMRRSEFLDVVACHDYRARSRTSSGRLQTCGLCLKVCPVGTDARRTGTGQT
jgi:epoxyqueuosine reductase QueG